MNRLLVLAGFLNRLAPRIFPLFAALVVIPFLLWLPYLFPLDIDNTLGTLLEPGTPQETIDREVKAEFGELDELIILAWRPPDSLFTTANLTSLHTLDRRLHHLPDIRHVFSLASVPYFRNQPDPDSPGDTVLDTSPLLDTIPTSPEILAALEKEALAHPVHLRNVISPDGRTAAFQVILTSGLTPDRKEETVRRIRETVEAMRPQLPGEFHFTGMHVFMEATGRTMENDIFRFSLYSAVALFLFLLLAFRSVVLPVIAMLTAGSAVGLLFLTLHWMGRALSIATTPVPAITMGLAIAYSLHYLVSQREGSLHRKGEAEEITAGMLLSAMTTMAGFASIALNPIPTLQDLGIFASLGTGFAALTNLFLTLPVLTHISEPLEPRPLGGNLQQYLYFIIRYKSSWILTGSALILLSGGMIFTMDVETDYYRYYRAESEMTRAVDFVNGQVGGQYPILVELRADQSGRIADPDVLDFLQELKERFETRPGVDKVITWVDMLNEGHRAFDESLPPGWYHDATQRAQVEMLVRDSARDLTGCYIDADNRRTVVFLRTSHINTADFRNVTAALKDFLNTRIPAGLQARLSGTYIRTVNSADRMAMGQFYGTFWALAVIFSIVFLILQSPRLTLIALTANVLPVLGIYGLLGMLGETLNMGTTTIAAIALGIGVDDTIHFLTRYIGSCSPDATPDQTIQLTLSHAGTAILLTSGAVSLSFIALILSDIKPLFQLGAFTAVAMGLCLIADVFLLPVLLVRWGRPGG